MKSLKTVKILVPYPFDIVFDYIVPENMKLHIGDIVKAPFGRRISIGVVWAFGVSEVEAKKLKKVQEKLDFAPLKKEMLNFVKWVSEYNLAPLGSVMKMVVGVVASFKKPRSLKQNNPIQNIEKTKSELYTLSDEQKQVLEFINEKIEDDKKSVIVLEGATGSGKTEVYFHLIVEQKHQTLILLPEISLTSQLISRFEQQFGFKPAVWHSQITSAQKRDMWNGIASGEVKVVIGARSALFLPFKHLDLIIVDEEHDSSFKQSDNGSYNARDMAIVRAKLNDIPIILSSATPSLETLVNVENGKYYKVCLPSRYGQAVMPNIEIVNLKKHKIKFGHCISSPLIEKIREHLREKKQVLLFLNRRGYAPIVLCNECGHKVSCPHCSCALVKHKRKQRLICHQCGYTLMYPQKCPECGKESLVDFGIGVEKVEEEARKYFAEANSVVITSDTINTPKKSAEMIEKIIKGEADIIIGTQLIAKGHHFPRLTLVGILDADASLFGGDIRASERTYQLLTQVSGRAGREVDRGTVVIQTYTPDNLVLKAIAKGNKEILIEFEKKNREIGGFPPYGRLAIILVSGRNESEVQEAVRSLAKEVPYYKGIEVLGPAPASVLRVQKDFRYKIFIKTERKINIQKLIKDLLSRVKISPKLKIKVDIDPYEFE